MRSRLEGPHPLASMEGGLARIRSVECSGNRVIVRRRLLQEHASAGNKELLGAAIARRTSFTLSIG